jgi:hypothetical protein
MEENLLQILDEMDVPAGRKQPLDLNNLEWLKQNLGVKNSENPSYPSAVHFINHLLHRIHYTTR